MLFLIALAASLALVSVGGGISRRRFWIPAHVAFELLLIASLVAAWSRPEVRTALVAASRVTA